MDVINPKKNKKPECQGEGEYEHNGKRYVRVITSDVVRDLLVPSTRPNAHTAVFCDNEFSKLENRSQIDTPEEKARKEKLAREEKRKKAEESAFRKRELMGYDVYRSFGPILTELEEDAKKKANHLMERVRELKKEQADEIKTCNTIILSKKCQAIRDAQIEEKRVIEKELKEEEERLEKFMEQQRMKALYEEEQAKLNEADRKASYRDAIVQQIRDNELEREIMAERVEEEQRFMNEAVMQIKLDELQEMRKKFEHQTKVREELNVTNSKIMELAEKEKQEAKLSDLRIQECIRLKVEDEAKREEEVMKKKAEKEKALAKLRANQQRAQDKKGLRDEMEAKKLQYETEKEFREKEKKAEEARARKLEELKIQREKQLQEKRRLEAIEAELEKLDLAKAAALERELCKQEEEQRKKRKKEMIKYKEDLLKQINEKEKERIKQKRMLYEEGFLAASEQKYRDEDLKETMMKKIKEIRTHNIPEKYIKDIERKMNLIQD